MSSHSMILYVKAGCPWCRMAEDYLDKRGYEYKKADVRRDIVAEVVEQQKWVEIGGVPEAEGAAQMHARPFERGL